MKFVLLILSILGTIASLALRLYTKRNQWYFIGVVFIFIATISPQINTLIDTWRHSSPDKKIKSEFPQDVDFFAHRLVSFNSGTSFSFNSSDFEINIKLTKIFERNKKFYISLLYDVIDVENNTEWLNQNAEVELLENKLWIGKTDRLDFYFYVYKTALGNADIYIGIKKAPKGYIMKNLIFNGNVVKFN